MCFTTPDKHSANHYEENNNCVALSLFFGGGGPSNRVRMKCLVAPRHPRSRRDSNLLRCVTTTQNKRVLELHRRSPQMWSGACYLCVCRVTFKDLHARKHARTARPRWNTKNVSFYLWENVSGCRFAVLWDASRVCEQQRLRGGLALTAQLQVLLWPSSGKNKAAHKLKASCWIFGILYSIEI